MKVNESTIYMISKYSKETGIGDVYKYCASYEAVIDYLTTGGRRHGVLTDQFGDNVGEFYENMVLKFTWDKDPLYELLGRESEPDIEYYIVHTVSLFHSYE